MKNYRLLITFAVAGFLAFGATRAQARNMILNVKLTILVQGLDREQVGESDVYKSTVTKVKVTNKDLVGLLERAYDADFTGDTLVIDYFARDYVLVDSGGNEVVNVTHSGFMAPPFDDMSDDVYTGLVNNDKGILRETYYCTCTILKFTDAAHGMEFTFGGMTQRDYTMTKSAGGDRVSINVSGAGPGSTGPNQPFVVTGTINGKYSD